MFHSPSPRRSIAGAWIMTSLAGKHLSISTSFLICGHGRASNGVAGVKRAQCWKTLAASASADQSLAWEFTRQLIYVLLSKPRWTGVFSPSCLVANRGKSCCCWLTHLGFPLQALFPLCCIWTINYCSSFFKMVNNFLACWVIIFMIVANQENLFVGVS